MDDKDDPYNKSYSTKPALPPFSSLRQCSSAMDGSYGSSELDRGYGPALSQQQQQLYSFSPYLQGNSSQYHQPADFPHRGSTGGLQRTDRPPQLSNYQSLPFHGNSTQASNFQPKEQSQFLTNLQHPPIPDMSLSIPFSAGQSGMLNSSHLPTGMQAFSDGRHFRTSTDHPPQIPLSQVESFLSEAEQKSISDFNPLSQTMETHHGMNQPWQPSYNSGQAKVSEQLPSFSSFSSFYTGPSNTKDMYLTSELPSKTDSFSSRHHIPESINSFAASTLSPPRYASQYQLAGNSYSDNYFLPKQASGFNSNDIHFSNFRRVSNNCNEQNNMFRMTAQGNQINSRSEPQEMFNVAGDDPTSALTKGSRKGRKKKKLTEKSTDTEVKSLPKKRKPRASKKAAKCQPNKEYSAPLTSINSDTDSASPAVCLSPTFIASLSSKRASDPQLPDASHSGLFSPQQNNLPQRNQAVPGVHNASLQTSYHYHVPDNIASYSVAPTTYQPPVSCNNQFPVNSQMPFTSIRHPSAKPLYPESYDRNDPNILSHQTGTMCTPNSSAECKRSRDIFNESQVETEEEERSLSPFQLSPGFIASLSSKRAEDHPVHKSLMEPTPDSLLESHSRPINAANCGSKYPFSRQPSQTSRPLLTDHAHSEFAHSTFHHSFIKQANPPPRIQLYNKPELHTAWGLSFEKPSLSQECNFKHMNSSPKQYVSPPAYAQGSEFQYPTPPMDDDESKLQSPGLCISPKFLDNLSNKIASSELSHRLSPNHDDCASVLPTPPNSAGPKQPFLPDITLSKEEQTSRILEIIARERDKASTTYQSSPAEPMKKKKKKKSNDLDNSSDRSKLMGNQLSSKQMEQHTFPYCSESSADNDSSYQKYPEMLGTLPDHTNCFGTLSSNTDFVDNKGDEPSLNYQVQLKQIQQRQMGLQEKDCSQFDFKEAKPTFRFAHSDSFQLGDVFNKSEAMQRHFDNLQGVEFQNHASMSQNMDEISFNKHLNKLQYLGKCEESSSTNHFPLQKPNSTPVIYEKEPVKVDPYAFDDSEQSDMIGSLTRNIKPGVSSHCLAQAKHEAVPISYSPYTAQTKSLDMSVSNVPFPAGAKSAVSRPYQPLDEQFYSADPMLTAERAQNMKHLSSRQIWATASHPNESHHMQPDKMFIENEQFSSHSHSHGIISNMNHQLENQHRPPQLTHNTPSILKDQHYTNLQHFEEHKPLQQPTLSFCSDGMAIKQEPYNLSCSMQDVTDNHKSFPDSLNGRVSNISKRKANKSLQLNVVKKKRGRPPKHPSSGSPSPANPKVPKLKLQEKKLKMASPKKLVYSLNGTEVSSSDLNINHNLVNRLANNLVEVADCSCLGPDHIPSETTEGPYYTQLGAARDIPGVRKVLEQRTGISGSAIRIEKVIYTGKEGKSKEGCPIAKWIIRRAGAEEKYLCIVRKRPGHFCDTAVIIMVIVAWEGVDRQQADTLYDFLISTLPQNGLETDRRCGLNEKKTCACQGVDLLRRGASFSFGCSWSMYYNGCKFARSQMARKFKLKDVDCEDELEDKLQKLATDVAPLYSQLAPDAFRNQTQFEKQAHDCRLGRQPGRPFSGVTAVVDFCCHSHRDCHNMNNGSTVVVNLTKHRRFEKPEDEQYHVLPLYILDQTDEHGTMEGQMTKVCNGSLQILSRYMTQVRRRSTPYRPCQRNRTTPKKQGLKKSPKKSKLLKAKSLDGSDETFVKSESSSFGEDEFLLPQSPSMDTLNTANGGRFTVNLAPGVGLDNINPESMSYTDLMSQQGTPGFGDLYANFWDYFYTHGEFPPCEWMSKKRYSAPSKSSRPSPIPDAQTQPAVAGQVFVNNQQWQQQEQRRLQQHNVHSQSGRSQQQEDHRQQNLSSYLPGKQDFHSQSLSPHPQYPQTSPRQQPHPHSYPCESLVPKSPHPPPATPHQESVSHKRQASMPLTPSQLQHQQPSEPPSPSGQSPFITSTSSHHPEAHRDSSFNSHPDHFHQNHSVSSHSTPQSNHTVTQIPALRPHAPPGGCDEHSVKPPPPYHQSISNPHKMQCGPPEALCTPKPQGLSPPSYCESLAQSSRNIMQFNESKGDMNAFRLSSNNSSCGPHSSSQSAPYPSPGQTQLVERPHFQPMLQRSFSSNSHERPPSNQSGSEIFVPRPLSVKSSEGQSSDLQRLLSSQSSPRSMSVQSLERPQSAQSIPDSSYVQSMSSSTSMQLPGALPKPNILLKSGSHASQMVQRPASAMSVKHPISEQSTPRSLSLQFFERKQSFHSGDGSQLIQREQRPASSNSGEMSPSQPNTLGPYLLNQQGCYQRDVHGTNSSLETTSIEHNGPDLLKKFTSNMTGSQSCIPDSPIMPSDLQGKTGKERSWSRMSEPTTSADVARPSSCFSEPGLQTGWRAELPFNITASKIVRKKPSFEAWASAGTSTINSGLDHSRIVNSENTQDIPNSDLHDREAGSRQGLSNPIEASYLTQSSMLKTGVNNLQQSYMQGKERSPHEGAYSGFVDGQAATVCPNGPVIGEKMKVHKSEGFVIPKLGQGPREPPYEVIDSTVASEEIDDNREAFSDPAMGGVAIALCHGAVLFEVAKRELHATTALKEPNRYQPKRISLVFYQHKNLNLAKHGFDEYERKVEERRSQAEQARLIEEMESKGFLKGELSELATFPNLTKGTFGKVFNFPESKETLFPLRFPRYLDSSHSEQITPVMFACMSIAFPKYMKEAFPNPAKLPRLIGKHMPGRMHSSLSDKRRDYKPEDSEIASKELQFFMDKLNKSEGTFQKVLGPWNPNIPQGHTVTTDRVITRWVHSDVSVTGPYNRWVELILQDSIKKEDVEAESEADLKEKMFESLSQLDYEAYINDGDMSSSDLKYPGTTMKTCHESEHPSTTTMVINLEPNSKDLDHSTFSGTSFKKEIELTPSLAGNTEQNKTSKDITVVPEMSINSSEHAKNESQRTISSRLETCIRQRMSGGRAQPDPTNVNTLDARNVPTETVNIIPTKDSVTMLKNDDAIPEPFHDLQLRNVTGDSQMSERSTADVNHLKPVMQTSASGSHLDLIRKLAAREDSLNHRDDVSSTEDQTNAGKDAPGSISLAGNAGNHTSQESYTSKVDVKFEGGVCSVDTKRRENVYDFLMKGLNRSFLSSHSSGVQDVQNEVSNRAQDYP